MPYRVLHIIRAPLGGAFRHVFDLAREQARRGLHVGVICDDADYGDSSSRKLEHCAAFCELGLMRMRIPRTPSYGDARAVRQIRKALAHVSPQLIHGHGAKGAAYARLLAPGLAARAVCTPHGGALHFSYRSPSGAAYLLIERALKGRTNGMIFESDYARREYVAKVGELSFPHRVVYNGLYDDEFAPIVPAARRYDFVFIGEYRTLKGIFTLLDAARELHTMRPFSLLMVGSGPDEQALRARVAQYGLSDIVTVSGPIHPARDAFAQARFVVVPSHKESMPYIVLEAIAAGMPVLTTAVGGIPEIFGARRDLLLPPESIEPLRERMAAMLENPTAAATDALELQRDVGQHLRVAEMERGIFELYREIDPSAHARSA